MEQCYEEIDTIADKLFPKQPQYVTKDEAYNSLIEEYAKALSEGDDTIASLNINEWEG